MKVLVATDGSEFSQVAIEMCCSLFSGSDDTQVRIVSVAQPEFSGIDPMGMSALYYTQMTDALQEQAKDAVSKAAEFLKKDFPDLAAGMTTEVLTGSPKACIVEEAEDWGADLIIIGSHGYGFWQRALLGSVSDAVTKHAPCSVLVVREPGK